MAENKGKRPRRSPAMEQFFRAKEAHPDAILFFRLGDFYEMFFEDAVLASSLLDLTLTSRGADSEGIAIPMAGVPHHAAASYIARLIEQGQRVAICEQMEDPSKVKGIVAREVVRVVTPALVLDADALDARAANYLGAVTRGAQGLGLALFELGAAEVRATELGSEAEALAELVRADVRELLVPEPLRAFADQLRRVLPRATLRMLDASRLGAARAEPEIQALLQDAAVGPAGQDAAALALKYALDAQPGTRLDVQRIVPYDARAELALDDAAIRNLELATTLSGDRKGSLLHFLDVTKTPMGARLLRRRLLAPLTQVDAIRRRHDNVEAFVADATFRDAIRSELAGLGDLERLATRASLGIATPRDLGAIREALGRTQRITDMLKQRGSQPLPDALAELAPADSCSDVRAQLAEALVDEPPISAANGDIFRAEHAPQIAELRELSTSSKDVILRLEGRERAATGISSLKIRYTRVFGYYIEITRSKAGAVPAEYRRKQTVAGAERFTTDELDAVQAKILNADERLRSLENELFVALRKQAGQQAPRLRTLAQRIAEVDVHAALADIAHRNDYVRPQVDDSLVLELEEARHPIVERVVAHGQFVPNDVRLDVESDRLMVITGPNMAGKSTTMRQVALAVIMAQAGSFVPAKRARVGLCDRIYTRVGASDNLAAGQSTFMIEMRETANILIGATRRSLVILDEIGRGTSTYDGLSIAWAVAEYLHDVIGCRAMFATHYHELCDLAELRSGVVNYNVAAKEHGENVVFLHRLVAGGANRSYGVAVARLAGVPEIVLARARAILHELEGTGTLGPSVHRLPHPGAASGAQLEIFAPVPVTAPESAVEATLRELDLDRLTPIDALVALARLRALLPAK
ncbi:MAG TPA: DNA mismatch repair protein MutS [Polyangiales bacterium]